MKKLLFAFLFLQIISCTQKQYDNPHILIDTNYGEIEAELYPTKAPKTVNAFLSYIDSGFYKNTTFYRVLKNEDLPMDINYGVIQGGVWPQKKNVAGVEHESTRFTGLSHTNGALSLARTSIGTATTEFFICIGDETQFDAGNNSKYDTLGFAAFGSVVKGMDIVRKIQAQKNTGEDFDTKIIINNIEKL
jgi:peptidyl-prolyl cis-trans isomerase A (cyclophilin A)